MMEEEEMKPMSEPEEGEEKKEIEEQETAKNVVPEKERGRKNRNARKLEALHQENDKLSAEKAEIHDKYIRLYSEFDNYRRRTQKEKLDIIKNASEKIIVGLLPVLDDMERAECYITSYLHGLLCLKDGVVRQVYDSTKVVTLYMGMENIGGGVANLAWNRPTLQMTNDVPTYTLYRRGFGRDSVRVTGYSYRDTVTVCGDTLEYVLVLDLPKSAGNPCIRYISPVCRDYFSDFTAPDTARLDSVSLRPESRCCEIGWQPSKSKDVFGYIVYIYEDGIWKVMDTLHGASNTFYADTLHADGSVHEYRIASLDTCRNASPLGEIHHTMVLSATPNKCDSAVSLSWNAYAHMPGGAASFEVFARSGKGHPNATCFRQFFLLFFRCHIFILQNHVMSTSFDDADGGY